MYRLHEKAGPAMKLSVTALEKLRGITVLYILYVRYYNPKGVQSHARREREGWAGHEHTYLFVRIEHQACTSHCASNWKASNAAQTHVIHIIVEHGPLANPPAAGSFGRIECIPTDKLRTPQSASATTVASTPEYLYNVLSTSATCINNICSDVIGTRHNQFTLCPVLVDMHTNCDQN